MPTPTTLNMPEVNYQALMKAYNAEAVNPQSSQLSQETQPSPGNTPAQPNPYAGLQEQAARHEAEYAEEKASWKKTLDDLVAEKADLYKADPKPAESKRKEAALKTLVSAFGSLADTIAVANGGTAPLRDYRQDISQTHQQADALDQGERAKETAAYQKYLDRLERHINNRPKWKQNDALLKYMDMISRDETRKENHAFQEAQQKRQQDFTASENEKNRAAGQTRVETQQEGASKRTAATNAAKKTKTGDEPKESEIVRLPLSDGGHLILKKGFWNSGALEIWIDTILKDERFDENTRKKIRSILSDVGKMDNKQVQETELGKLLSQYPEFEEVLKKHGTVVAPANVPSDPNVPTDAQGNPLSEIY